MAAPAMSATKNWVFRASQLVFQNFAQTEKVGIWCGKLVYYT